MEFESIKDYYGFIEQDNSILFDSESVTALIFLRDKLPNQKEKEDCSIELLITELSLHNGEVNGRLKYENGEQFPNVSMLNGKLDYLISRSEATVNPKYKAKYSHILWESQAKNIKYARLAVDSYMLFLTKMSYPLPDNRSNHVFEDAFKNMFILSQKINYKIDESINFLLLLLETDKINGFKKCNLMDFICEKGKKLDKAILEEFFEFAKKVVESKTYPLFTQSYLLFLINISQKLGVPQKPFYIKLGEYFIDEAEKDARAFVKHDYYQKAMTQFQKAGETKKVEDVSVLIEQSKKDFDFKAHRFEYEDDLFQQWWDLLREFTDNLTEQATSNEIFNLLASTTDLLPTAKSLEEEIRPVMFDFMSVTTYDINRNISNDHKSGINPYHIHFTNFTIRYLWLVFTKGYKCGKITYNSLMEYLRAETWYGQNINYNGTDERAFDWLALLSPAIKSFFDQTDIDLKTNSNNHQGYILAVDSTVIKFEGLLREFSKMIGAQTIEKKDNGTTERISFDKLLDNKKIKQILPEDDIAFFKYLFTKNGMNLRNNVAHCFYKDSDYSAVLIFLLITAMLRLGNYKLKIKTEG